MKIWKLSVLNTESSDWMGSTYKGEVVTRAESEQLARRQARSAFKIATELVPGQSVSIDPWSQPKVVSCELDEDGKFEADGEAGILSPPGYAPNTAS